jgi:hypothetical protein
LVKKIIETATRDIMPCIATLVLVTNL